MKGTNLLIGCTVALMFWLCYSCKSDDFIPSVEVTTSENTDLMSLKDYGYYETLHLEANTDWKIECDSTWYYTLPSEGGPGSQDIKLCVTDNGSAIKKTGKLIFVFSNGDKKEIDLQQNGKEGNNADMPVEGYKKYAVGHGYDYFGRAANPASVKFQIFDVTSMIDDLVMLQNSASSHFESKTVTGSSNREISAKISVNAGLEGQYMGFSGEVNASFDDSYTSNVNYEFAIFSGKAIQTEWYIDSNIDSLIQHYLIPGVAAAINGTSDSYKGINGIQQLITDYGTHVVMKAYLGGKYSINLAVDRSQITSAYDIGAFASVAYKNAFVDAKVSVDAKYSESYTKNKNSIQVGIDILGGSPETKSSTAITSEGGLDNWEKSLLTNDFMYCALVAFDDNSLVPIWELCSDADGNKGLETERGRAIKAYIEGDYYSTVELKSPNSESITIPNFESNASTLIKTARLSSGDNQVAEICNEYIPALSLNSRVTVVYPVVNGAPRYDAGLFIGNSEHHPAKVSWSGFDCSITEIDSLPKTALKIIYKQGMSFSTVPYSDKNVTVVTDQFWNDKDENGLSLSYPLVKFGGYTWIRSNYRGVKQQGYALSGLEKDWRIGIGSYCVMEGEVYYDIFCLSEASSERLRIEPIDWKVPSNTLFGEMIRYIKGDNKDVVFLKSGLSGLDLPTGYTYTINNKPIYVKPSANNPTTILWTSDISLFEIDGGDCFLVENPSGPDYYSCNVRLVRKADYKYY